MEENEITTPSSEENTSEALTPSASEQAADGDITESTTEDNSYLQLLRVDENLCEFQFEDTTPESPTLYDINYNVMHLYNLVLLIAFFLICSWLVDKVFTSFNSIWKRW